MLTWSIGSLNAAVHSQTVTLNATVVQARAEWGRGAVELLYNDENDELKSCQLNNLPHSLQEIQREQQQQQQSYLTQKISSNATAALATSTYAHNYSSNAESNQGDEPTIAFIGKHEIVLVALHTFLPAESLSPSLSPSSVPFTTNSQTKKGSVHASCRLDHTRRIECVMECKEWKALLIITCDNNGWRWINFLHSLTAEPITTAEATLDFAGDDQVNVIAFFISSVLHVYLLGTDSGTVGHFYFIDSNSSSSSDNDGNTISNMTSNTIIQRNCFAGPTFHTLPCTFRGYGRFLPPQPTMKEETGFFKRLMTLPWEDVVLQMESATLRQVSKVGEIHKSIELSQQLQHEQEQYESMVEKESKLMENRAITDVARSEEMSRDKYFVNSERSLTQSQKDKEAISPSTIATANTTTPKTQEFIRANSNNQGFVYTNKANAQSKYNDKYETPAATTSASPSSSSETEHVVGSRYAQLKAIAEREHVSLTEARRMMSENVRKLQERGEKIGAIENKSSELAQQALTFQELARQLKEKKRNSWL